jgi:hypothetical protein
LESKFAYAAVPVQRNEGVSVSDIDASGSDSEPVETWRARNSIDITKQIRLVKLSHMRYQHPDLDEITTFLLDFGMHVVKSTDEKRWFRGYGPDQYVYYAQKGPKKFLGGTFETESYGDLENAAKLQGASAIEKLDDAPGGGHLVTTVDPEGFPICFVHGQEPAKVGQFPGKTTINYELEKPRVRKFQRFRQGPAAVHKVRRT